MNFERIYFDVSEELARSAKQAYSFSEVLEDAEDMRIRLIFEGKPSEEIRSILKSNGFIWSGKNKAWQRMLNNNGKRAVNTVLELLKEVR